MIATLIVLAVMFAIARIDDVRSKARRIRQLHADDRSIEAFNDRREALR